jgi:hypothetical protein
MGARNDLVHWYGNDDGRILLDGVRSSLIWVILAAVVLWLAAGIAVIVEEERE